MPDPRKNPTTLSGPRPNVVILNDTSHRHHHGCSRVMRLLVDNLERHGLNVIDKSAARSDWSQDRVFLENVKRASLIVVNGEGTIHHARPAGEALLKIVDHPNAQGCPVVLINALYQSNPPSWGRYLSKFNLLSARDPKSADEMRLVCQQAPVQFVPDFSLSSGAEPQNLAREGVVVGDSVRMNLRRVLARCAIRIRADRIVPIKTLRYRILDWPIVGPVARMILFSAYFGVYPRYARNFEVVNSEAEYLRVISGAAIHITGRFHSVCLSLLTGTPFLAIGSNSRKIEALLQDAGIGIDRMLDPDQLKTLDRAHLTRPFDDDEKTKIATFLKRTKQQSDALMLELATLAAQGRS
jgi:hypothetical protein